MAPLGEPEQLLVLGALGALGQQLPVQRRAGRLPVEVPQVGEQQQARCGAAPGELGRLLLQRLQEAYPNLQSQARFGELMHQLESTENRINIAIRDYNEAVRRYNTEIRTFPSVIGAKVIYGAEPMATYQATAPNADVAPTVAFDTSTNASR